MKTVDIYDFDKTMIPFDSGSLFWIYCLIHYPWIIICGPYQFIAGLLWLFGFVDLTWVKGPFFSFIRLIPLEKAVKKFWDKYEKKVFDWAKKENRPRFAVVISASPDFLMNEIGKRLSFDDLICTVHNKNGSVIGRNCHDREKVRLFREKYPDAEVIDVFSDSINNDKFIFSLGKNCYNTVYGERIKFDFYEKYGVKPENVK